MAQVEAVPAAAAAGAVADEPRRLIRWLGRCDGSEDRAAVAVAKLFSLLPYARQWGEDGLFSPCRMQQRASTALAHVCRIYVNDGDVVAAALRCVVAGWNTPEKLLDHGVTGSSGASSWNESLVRSMLSALAWQQDATLVNRAFAWWQSVDVEKVADVSTGWQQRDPQFAWLDGKVLTAFAAICALLPVQHESEAESAVADHLVAHPEAAHSTSRPDDNDHRSHAPLAGGGADGGWSADSAAGPADSAPAAHPQASQDDEERDSMSSWDAEYIEEHAYDTDSDDEEAPIIPPYSDDEPRPAAVASVLAAVLRFSKRLLFHYKAEERAAAVSVLQRALPPLLAAVRRHHAADSSRCIAITYFGFCRRLLQHQLTLRPGCDRDDWAANRDGDVEDDDYVAEVQQPQAADAVGGAGAAGGRHGTGDSASDGDSDSDSEDYIAWPPDADCIYGAHSDGGAVVGHEDAAYGRGADTGIAHAAPGAFGRLRVGGQRQHGEPAQINAGVRQPDYDSMIALMLDVVKAHTVFDAANLPARLPSSELSGWHCPSAFYIFYAFCGLVKKLSRYRGFMMPLARAGLLTYLAAVADTAARVTAACSPDRECVDSVMECMV